MAYNKLIVALGALTLAGCTTGMVGSAKNLCGRAGAAHGTPERDECLASATYVPGGTDVLAPRFQARLNGAPVGRFGEGLAAYNAGNYEASRMIFLPDAQAGLPEAQNRMGLLYEYGLTPSTPKSDALAAEWFGRAALQNYVDAMWNLARVQKRLGHFDVAEQWTARAQNK